MGIIEAGHYEEKRNELMADPIIQKMADEIPDGAEVDYSAWGFISKALDEYKQRGGQIQTHIGGPAEAIRNIVRARK
jgi:hypothetical protein